MFNQEDILDEKNSILRKTSVPVIFPMEQKEIDLAKYMIEYLKLSQDDEYAEKNGIRGGMGLAFVQLGILKRLFVIASKNEEDNSFTEYIIINPKIISHSEEQIYVEEGEGCLSVNRETCGVVPRYARITVEYYDFLGQKHTVRVREEIAIAFQHEIDHLNGILFVDKIDKKNPYQGMDTLRSI